MGIQPWQRMPARDIFAGVREVQIEVSKGNGKSGFFAPLGLYQLGTLPRAFIPIGAASIDQAALVYEEVHRHAQHPLIRDRLWMQRAQKEARNRALGGRLKVYSSDGSRAHGPGPSLAFLDEYWAHLDNRLYTAFRSALGKFPGQLVGGSTAGSKEDSPLGRLRGRWRQLPNVTRPFDDQALTVYRSADGMFVAYEWELTEDDDLTDPLVLKRANPASFVTVDWLREQIDSPSLMPNELAQFHANVWQKSYADWLPPGAWRACEGELTAPDQSEAVVAVDIGLKRDASSVAVCVLNGDTLEVSATVFKPKGDGTPLSFALVEGEVRRLARKYEVREVAFDPFMFARSAETLSDEGLLMVEFPQTNERMAPATSLLREAIVTRRLRHDGDPVLAAHVAGGTLTFTDRGARLTKRGAKAPNDALIAVTMAVARADRRPPRAGLEWW